MRVEVSYASPPPMVVIRTEWIVGGEIPSYVRNHVIDETTVNSIISQEVDLVFSALPAEEAVIIEEELASHGVKVFSNTSAHRMKEKVPILIPEINPSHLKLTKYQETNGYIITNSNCTTAGLVFGLQPLSVFGIKSVVVTTFQAVSGGGRTGVSSMNILGNVIPYIPNEEEKMESETKKILGKYETGKIIPANFKVNASCVRVPVKYGHLESVVVELEQEIDVEEAKRTFENYSSNSNLTHLPTSPKKIIEITKEQDGPQPARDLVSANFRPGMTVKIGRLRKKDQYLSFFLLTHNTVRGAAGTTILSAEFAEYEGFLKSLE